MNYGLHLGIFLAIYVILALSLDLIVGWLGQLSLAHAGFLAIGAYTYALTTLKLGWSFPWALGLSVTVAVATSLLLSLPAWRFRGDFFVMISLAVGALIQGLAQNWSTPGFDFGTWRNLTNGTKGLAGIPNPVINGIRLDTEKSMLVLAWVLALLCTGLYLRLTRSPWGRLLKCLRDDELAVRGLGKNVRLLKVQVFALSCAMAAVAGVIYAAYTSYIDPAVASLDESILLLCMVCVGGLGNLRGPLIGAAILLLIPELLRLTTMPEPIAANVRLLAYGLLLVAAVHLRPQGIAGEYRIE